MQPIWKTILWQQFGAALDMLENAMRACPDAVWFDRSRPPEFWYLVFHTLFWLDFDFSEAAGDFTPPPPYTLAELDPAGVMPERPYTKDELERYLDHGRQQCRAAIASLSDEQERPWRGCERLDAGGVELVLYQLRHVQHHAAQLNLLLRQRVDAAPRWVRRTQIPLPAE
ncbi:MAG: DinB family protein [Acidobacteriia bacterium]|nr:DinB family protein [Terriglobia bacterium]